MLKKINVGCRMYLMTWNIKYKKIAFALNYPKNNNIIDLNNLNNVSSGAACFTNSIKFINLYKQKKDLDDILNQISNGNDFNDIFLNNLLNFFHFFGKLPLYACIFFKYNLYILKLSDSSNTNSKLNIIHMKGGRKYSHAISWINNKEQNNYLIYDSNLEVYVFDDLEEAIQFVKIITFEFYKYYKYDVWEFV